MHLTAALRRCLELGRAGAFAEREEIGEDAAYVAGVAYAYFFINGDQWDALWREHRADVLEDWIASNPGTRPWAWWQYDATEPRLVIRGADLLVPRKAPTDWAWVWRENFGVPAMRQARPAGCTLLPLVEAEASYLERLTLFVPDERERLTPEDFAPEAHNPFLIDAGHGAVRFVSDDDDKED